MQYKGLKGFRSPTRHSAYGSRKETFEVLANAEEVAGIRQGLADLRAGRSVSFEEVFGEPLTKEKPNDP
jgi:predicted transcriptional regulator